MSCRWRHCLCCYFIRDFVFIAKFCRLGFWQRRWHFGDDDWFLAMHRITAINHQSHLTSSSSCLWLPIRYYLWQQLPRLCCGYKSANSNVKPFTVSGSINYLHSKAWKPCCLIWLLWVSCHCRFRCCWALSIPPFTGAAFGTQDCV